MFYNGLRRRIKGGDGQLPAVGGDLYEDSIYDDSVYNSKSQMGLIPDSP